MEEMGMDNFSATSWCGQWEGRWSKSLSWVIWLQRIHTCVRAHTHTYIHKYIHINTHTCKYTYTWFNDIWGHISTHNLGVGGKPKYMILLNYLPYVSCTCMINGVSRWTNDAGVLKVLAWPCFNSYFQWSTICFNFFEVFWKGHVSHLSRGNKVFSMIRATLGLCSKL